MGPLTYQNYPNAPTLKTDPTQISTPGISQEMQQVRTNAGQQQGSANNAAMAALQRAGVAGGSEAGNALGNIASQASAGTASALAGLQNQQFGQQSQLMDALNNAQNQLYNTKSQATLGQNQQTGQNIGSDVSGILALASLFA